MTEQMTQNDIINQFATLLNNANEEAIQFITKSFYQQKELANKKFLNACLEGDLETAKQLQKKYPTIIEENAYKYYSKKNYLFWVLLKYSKPELKMLSNDDVKIIKWFFETSAKNFSEKLKNDYFQLICDYKNYELINYFISNNIISEFRPNVLEENIIYDIAKFGTSNTLQNIIKLIPKKKFTVNFEKYIINNAIERQNIELLKFLFERNNELLNDGELVKKILVNSMTKDEAKQMLQNLFNYV